MIAPKISELSEFELEPLDPFVEPDPTQFSNTAFLLGMNDRKLSRGLTIAISAKNTFIEFHCASGGSLTLGALV